MTDSNSVFISYRRDASAYFAQAVFQDLYSNGIDVFFDVESINAGQFGTIILNQIAARPYFISILTPDTLDRCIDPNDWVRREIEHAIALKRQIVPLHTPEFQFSDIDKFLPADLAAALKSFNAVEVPHKYFRYAMQDVRSRFLVPISLDVTPTPRSDRQEVTRRLEQAAAEPEVTEKQLTAQECYEQATLHWKAGALDEALAIVNEAIRLDPNFAEAYSRRGTIKYHQGDHDEAIKDYNEAIRLDPRFVVAYYNRGIAYHNMKKYNHAITSFNAAIRIDPSYAPAYAGRGLVSMAIGDHGAALSDYNEAIKLNPDDPQVYNNRGIVRRNRRDLEGAVADHNEAIRLDPTFAMAYSNRGLARKELGDLDGAIADYNEAIRLNPKYVLAYHNRAYAYAEKQNYAQALKNAAAALDINDSFALAKSLQTDAAKWRKLVIQK